MGTPHGGDPMTDLAAFEAQWQDVPPPAEQITTPLGPEEAVGAELTTWEPVDLGPYLRGEVQRPEPSIGMARSDGLRLIYPGREHAVIGETESGKSWFGIGCAAVEILAGHCVLYVHYEESDPSSTVERFRLLGITDEMLAALLVFVAPARPVQAEWLAPLLAARPTLAIHDGVNEAMSLHGSDIMAADGAATFRRRLIVPCLKAGAAVLSCDHLPMGADGSRRNAYGSVHKINALDGAAFILENAAPMGRGLRGRSYLFATKDRPGHLREHGKPTKTPGKTFLGTLVVDATGATPDFLALYAPKSDETAPTTSTDDKLADAVHAVIAGLPDGTVASTRLLFAELRKAGHEFTDGEVRDTVDDLTVAGRLTEVSGKRGAKGYQAVLTASEDSTAATAAMTAAATASPLESDAVDAVAVTAARRSPTQSDAVEEELDQENEK